MKLPPPLLPLIMNDTYSTNVCKYSVIIKSLFVAFEIKMSQVTHDLLQNDHNEW